MGDKLNRRAIGIARIEKWERIRCCPRYYISSFGRVRRQMTGWSSKNKYGRIAKFNALPARYRTCIMGTWGLRIKLFRRNKKPHQHELKELVGQYFLPGLGRVALINGDPWNCSVYNLKRIKPVLSLEAKLGIIESLKASNYKSRMELAKTYKVSGSAIYEYINKLKYIRALYSKELSSK